MASAGADGFIHIFVPVLEGGDGPADKQGPEPVLALLPPPQSGVPRVDARVDGLADHVELRFDPLLWRP